MKSRYDWLHPSGAIAFGCGTPSPQFQPRSLGGEITSVKRELISLVLEQLMEGPVPHLLPPCQLLVKICNLSLIGGGRGLPVASSIRMQPTLQISAGKVHPKPRMTSGAR